MFPTTRIGPDLSRTVSKHHVSKPTQDVNRKHRPIRAAFAPAAARVSAKASVAPTRSSIDHGIATPTLEAVDPSVVDVQHQTVSPSVSGSSQSRLSNSASTTSLAGSESELSLLLNGADFSRPGTTTINIGSIPISVPIACIDVPASAHVADVQDQQQGTAAPAGAEESSTPVTFTEAAEAQQTEDAAAAQSKLNPTSAEFYPSAYVAAAAATALAAQSIGSSATQYSSGTHTVDQHTVAAADVEQQSQQEAGSDITAEQQQQPVVMEQQQMVAWQQQQQWSQQWQQPMPMPVPMFFPVPVPIPPYVMPAAYQYAWQQQQWHQQQQHMHMQQMQMAHQGMPQPVAPVAPVAAPHDGSSGSDAMGTPPPSPAPSLPADTSSLMSVPSTAAAHNWALAHGSSLYGSSRPGSSAGSVVSFAGNSRSRQQQERLRDAGTVTVSALSCVKDAAGALAKVVSRHGTCLLLSLARSGDIPAQATHVAAKSLAVARFYVNAHMAAEGSAGVDAAAMISGVEPATPAAEQQSADEVVFMPYHRSSSSNSRAADAEPPLGFMVAKASARDLPVVLPPPVGIPACMQDRQSQQQQQPEQSEAAAAAVHAYQSAAPLLKAGANTDVNKLSNAIIHNILGCNHVALQLAGAAACHVAMKALIKARTRLQRKFEADIVATASFANEDTSSSIGRSTVFLRLDVMRSNILKQLINGGAAAGAAISRTVSEVGEMVVAAQQQPAVATA